MMKILINAYACSPNMGSEPGMAWNWCVNLAQYCELHIITEGEFRDNIEAAISTLPQGKNMHFYYNPLPDKVRKMCWNQGDWRFYKYYRDWQKKTYKMALEIINNHEIDVVHQLNMIGFREPGYLWKVKEIPFVWGPVGGMELMPVSYLEGTSLSQKIIVLVKNMINRYQTKYSRRVLKAIDKSDVMVAAVKGVTDCVLKYHYKEIITINETGCYPKDKILVKKNIADDEFNILWVGKFDFRKQLALALKAIANLKDLKGVKLHIAGTGTDSEVKYYKGLAEQLNISDKCVWHGVIPHKEVQVLMQHSDVFLFTSIMEGTPHVILEAIGNNLPVICFDVCGQAEVVNEKVGIKVPLSNPSRSVAEFAEIITSLYSNRNHLCEMSANCQQRQIELSWDNKARQMVALYERAINSRKA